MKLKITMENKEKITLPLNQRTEITFKYDRIQFTEYYETGYKPYNLPENYYYEDIKSWEWEGF